ncbi:hypothetical protein BDR26DRAFT_932122 [Obelidium mucronatum]|nr:hypothetical protein BDR26DRAFT_932122 [Obelidium mucronatum]
MFHGNVFAQGMSKSRSIIVEDFIAQYARTNGLENPSGRSSALGHQCEVILSPSETKKNIHAIYTSGVENPLSYKQLWNSKVSWLKIGKPGSGFCDACIILAEEPSLNHLLVAHSTAAKQAKEEHQNAIITARNHNHGIDAIDVNSVLEIHAVASRTRVFLQLKLQDLPQEILRHIARYLEDVSRKRLGVYCFDLSEKVYLPRFHKQQNSQYFKTTCRIEISGFADALRNQALIFQMEEGSVPHVQAGLKDLVISMIHHALLSKPEQSKSFYADNCAGQNKNRWMMMYWTFRVILELEDEIKYTFMIAGHTKFIVDGFFGLFKKVFMRSETTNTRQLGILINNSAQGSKSIHDKNVKWYKFSEFLEAYFDGVIPAISRMHCFRFSSEFKGFVEVKEFVHTENWTRHRLLKKDITPADVVDGFVNHFGESFQLPRPIISDERLAQLDDIKLKLIHSDKEQFMPHMSAQFDAYRERVIQDVVKKRQEKITAKKYTAKAAVVSLRNEEKAKFIWSNQLGQGVVEEGGGD